MHSNKSVWSGKQNRFMKFCHFKWNSHMKNLKEYVKIKHKFRIFSISTKRVKQLIIMKRALFEHNTTEQALKESQED